MIKRLQELWGRLRQDRGQLKATVRVDFYANKTAGSRLDWSDTAGPERDTVSLAIFLYARILFELAEINETRVANELIAFLSQVVDLVLTGEGPPNRPRLPMGELNLQEGEAAGHPNRSYRADFFRQADGQYRIDFKGSLGKEGVYLPATYVVFLQECINQLDDEALRHLARSLGRLHDYYRFRKDFWESTALAAGPTFALGTMQLAPEEMELEVEG
jgi:hypothetical protein